MARELEERTIEIPKENWMSFLQLLNRHAIDRPLRLEVVNRELGDQEMGDYLPFRGMSFETKGSDRGDLLIITAADQGELTHRIAVPTHIYILYNEAAELELLTVEDADNGKTLMYFEHLPALPEEAHEEHRQQAPPA